MATLRPLEDRRRQARAVIHVYAPILAHRAGVKVELFDLLTGDSDGPTDWQTRHVRTLEDVAAFLAALASTGMPQGAPANPNGNCGG